MIYEAIIRRLYTESSVDSASRQIVKKIVDLINQRIDKLNAKKRITLLIKNLSPTNEAFNLKLTVTLKKRNDKNVYVSGSWVPALDELNINVFLETLDGTYDKTLTSDLYAKLLETVRHEVEHSNQEKPANMFTDEDEDEEESIIWTDINRLQHYFTSEREVSAFVSGLYHQAKRTRRPFIDVMNDKLDAYKRVALHYHDEDVVSQMRIKFMFDRIRNAWTEYAKKRFPKAVTQAQVQ